MNIHTSFDFIIWVVHNPWEKKRKKIQMAFLFKWVSSHVDDGTNLEVVELEGLRASAGRFSSAG